MHVIQHFLGTFGPDLIITKVAEETNTDDNIAFQRKTFLSFEESVLETGAAAESDDWNNSSH